MCSYLHQPSPSTTGSSPSTCVSCEVRAVSRSTILSSDDTLSPVQNVMEALFRMTSRSDPLFETLTPSNKLFLHFRFLAHTVVTTISSYVYDTAIGGHFDAFLSTLSPSTLPPTAPSSPLQSSTASRPYQTSTSLPKPQPHLSDVFALADRHSEVLDDILGACLLRSSQKAAGEVLRGILDTVLKFGILMSDLAAHRVQEYEAAAPLEDLYELFRRRCIALVSCISQREVQDAY